MKSVLVWKDSSIFSIIEFLVWELHWLEVKGVVVEFMEGFP
jgi:hypothetical protein